MKTSILFLDKSLARQSDTIAFFKVENDGFGLGAQRREIEKNDLPQVKAEIGEYLGRLRAGEAIEDFRPTLGLVVAKEKIAAKGEYSLSGERYREGNIRSSNFPLVPIGDICDLINGRPFKPEDWERADSGGIPIVRIQNLNTPESEFNYYTGEVRDCHIIKEGELLFLGLVHAGPRLVPISGKAARLFLISTFSRSALMNQRRLKCICFTH